MRHADAGDDAGGADAARADADLDGVRPGVDQRAGAFGGGDVASDDLHGIGQALDAGNAGQHAGRMPVGSVDADDVGFRGDQRLGPGEAFLSHAGGRGHAQAA